jgi:dihydroorotate dehydrogenase electron transfer subunit
MHTLGTGDTVWLRGPFGHGFSLCRGALMLIGRGCGLPPLLHLAQVARGAGRATHVALGARTAQGLFFQDRFAALRCAGHLLARERGLPCQFSYEAYMRCGIGVCGSCARGGCLVCRDGPVLDRSLRAGPEQGYVQ